MTRSLLMSKNCDEEEDDEAGLSEWESGEESEEEEEEEEDEECEEDEEEDSGWSDEDDEGDSEASAESLELWESFLNSSDPHNPLSFCSSISSRTNAKQNQQSPCSQSKTQSAPDTRLEECEPRPGASLGLRFPYLGLMQSGLNQTLRGFAQAPPTYWTFSKRRETCTT
ncbi:histone H3.v1-like [Labeo rohita]|uniref:histone H3.v1-like n=1 Tax=Labeo rohita TaxID=84645 RepID=UPI0021E2E2A4|nr:histone H3.v1-like [Labeo rohita]